MESWPPNTHSLMHWLCHTLQVAHFFLHILFGIRGCLCTHKGHMVRWVPTTVLRTGVGCRAAMETSVARAQIEITCILMMVCMWGIDTTALPERENAAQAGRGKRDSGSRPFYCGCVLMVTNTWHVGLSLAGGGGGVSIEPPKSGGGGFGKRAQLTGTINQSL